MEPTENRIQYPISHSCHYVMATDKYYKTREGCQKAIFEPQQNYYSNRLQAIVTGIPNTIDFFTYVPEFIADDNGTTNTSTVEQLLIREAGVGTPPDHTLRMEGSYILESTRYQQADFYQVCNHFLLEKLKYWFAYEQDSRLQLHQYLFWNNKRSHLCRHAKIPSHNNIPETSTTPVYPLVYEQNFAHSAAPPIILLKLKLLDSGQTALSHQYQVSVTKNIDTTDLHIHVQSNTQSKQKNNPTTQSLHIITTRNQTNTRAQEKRTRGERVRA